MSRTIWMILTIALLAGCSGGQQESDTSVADAATTEPVEYSPMVGSEITAADGLRATVISVGEFDANTKSLAGRVAVEGRVEESFAERDAFIMVDWRNEDGCTKSCCPQAEVPIRLMAGGYTGRLPRKGEAVVVIGDLSVTDTGYQFDVLETRSGAETLLRIAKAES